VSDHTLEAIATTLVNLLGFTGIVVLIIWVFRSAPDGRSGLVAKAAWALWWLWCVTLSLYVATEFMLAEKSPHNPPTWLEATNEILENLQSEVVQIWVAALVFKYLRWPGSPESK
jgi:hypothetical protein